MKRPAPFNLLRLRFASMAEFKSYWDEFSEIGSLIWRWHETIGDNEEPVQLSGICDLCRKATVFSVSTHLQDTNGFRFRASWGELICFHCRFNARDRHIITFLRDVWEPNEQIYHVGQYSGMASHLRQHFTGVTTSQYDESKKSGYVDGQGARYEDITQLSFGDKTYKYAICSEVLEHVPSYKPSLAEMHRVLIDDGLAIMTFPWLGGNYYDNFVRAELLSDGTVKHYFPPEYHGDPANSGGILSFRSFGWSILDELREVGFRDVYAEYKFGPLHGYMTLLAPIIIAVK